MVDLVPLLLASFRVDSEAAPLAVAAAGRVGSRGVVPFFFFQAEDGIRDHCVTGVQTCALPIWAIQSMRLACNWGGCCVRRFWLTTLSRTLSGTSCAGCSIGARLLTPSSAPFIPADRESVV